MFDGFRCLIISVRALARVKDYKMIEFVSNENKKDLILFVHGFTGDATTWSNEIYGSFPDLLLKEDEVKDKFDIAHFVYYTKLLNLFSKTSNVSKLVKKFLNISHGKLKKNISVDEIANLLRTEIRFKLQKYDNIVIVAHSMGGLVAKSCVVKDFQEKIPSKVKLFISLAVPHMGAELATFGKLISENIQIEDLAPLNKFIHETNDAWLKSSLRPETKYFYGVHDDVVAKTSASPTDKDTTDVISLDENHNSISKPEGRESTTFIAVKDVILNYQTNDPGMTDLKIQTLNNDSEYDDELFVLKLLMADIHNSTVRDAKEVFLNAEYMRKIFSSESEQKRLSELYEKVRKLYKDGYTKYIHDGLPNSGQLLAAVHDRIVGEDKEFLHTLIPFINAIHKQGMLHQLANDSEGNIWWSKDTGMEEIEKYLNGLKK